MTIALIGLLFLAQAPAERPANPVIEGRVVRAGSGEPVKKAQVALVPAEGRRQSYSASTDETGGFAFRDIDPGRYRFLVERNGFVRQEYGQRAPNRPGLILTLEAGQHLRDVVFRLIPSAVITGRILDEDGEPVVSASVRPLRYVYSRGQRQLTPFDGVTTNDLGEYRLHGLAPGRYYLSVRPRNWEMSGLTGAGRAPLPTGPEEGYAPTYFPGTVDPLQAAPLDVGPGAELRSVDIRLQSTATVRVRGRVFYAAGGPARGVMLTMVAVGSPMMAQHHLSVDDPAGAFEIRGATAGSWVLLARSSDGTRHYSARLPIEVGRSHLENIQLALSPDPDIPGRVVVEGNSDGAPSDLRVVLQPTDANPFGGASAPVKADATFLLPHVPAGRYFVSLAGQTEDHYLKDARLGQVGVLDGGFEVDGAAARPVLELVVSAAGGRLEGSVSSEREQSIGNAQIVLVPDSGRRHLGHLYKTAVTDEYGRFYLRGIAPGDYRLFAWEDVEPGAWRDPEFLRLYEERGETISVREGHRTDAKLKLIPVEGTGGAPGSTALTPSRD